MIKRIITALSKKLATARSKDKPTPSWEDIHKVLDRTAEIQARTAKQQAAWQASWEAQRAQEHKEHGHEREREREQERKEREEREREREQERKEREEREREREQKRKEREEREREREQKREREREQERKERAHERQEEQRQFAAWQASMNRVLKDMGVRVGGLTNNVGKIAEEYFFNALKNKKTITINGARFTNNNVLADKRFKKQKKVHAMRSWC